jgi:hypothetical protein
MRRTATVILIGLIGGFGAHYAYFQTHRPCTDATLACELAWIRDELDLSQEQFDRLARLHEMTEPRLLALADQLDGLRRQFDAFEAQRKGEGEIDFIEFSEFIAERRQTKNAYEDSSRSLVLASADLMEPEQRQRYLSLVGSQAGDSLNLPF